jgi:glycosyltransferase involved in cell wall biosynthesis
LDRPNQQPVLFIAGVEEAPLRYRVYLPSEALNLVGIPSRICYYTDKDLNTAVERTQLVVLHRVRATNQILKLIAKLRDQKIPVIYDIDDLIFDPDSARNIPWLKTRSAREVRAFLTDVNSYRTAIEECDGLITSTETLCKEAQRITRMPTRHFPNGIGLKLDHLSQLALNAIPFSTKPRLCYLSGTSTHQQDYDSIETALIATLEQYPDVELYLVGNITPSSKLLSLGDRIQRLGIQPWQHLPHLVRQMSINLAPLMLNNTFNESKSAIKWLEAALVEVPTIASPTGPNREMIEQGHTGFLAATTDDWQQALAQLIRDPKLGERVGKNARDAANEKLNARKQGERYAELVEWALNLAKRQRNSTGPVEIVPDNLLKPHPLEPYDLTLVANIPTAQGVSSDLNNLKPLRFSLDLGSATRVRIDLLFATHNGPGSDIDVCLQNSTSQMIGRVTVGRSLIAEGAWAAFEFEFTDQPGQCEVIVTLAESAPNSNSRVALWTNLNGTHLYGDKRRIGTPCLRLWVDEHVPAKSTPPVVNHRVKATERLRARFHFARYIYEIEGPGQVINRTVDYLLRNKTRWLRA